MKDGPRPDTIERRRLSVTGVVQGVGFRPYVYGLAARLKLTGFVGNNSRGLFIEIEGPSLALDEFQQTLHREPPPLAYLEDVSTGVMTRQYSRDFVIVESAALAGKRTLVSPDLSICNNCLRELFDPSDRRYGYPFINCTNCGPRFTIVKDIPYDRALTTMARFAMCEECRAEYEDPTNRRFHAQPNACPLCGPRVSWQLSHATCDRSTELLLGNESSPIFTAQRLLAAGRIVAVKGLGGFHLACDATNDGALRTLRDRKGRVDKPFAVMARDLESIGRIAHVNAAEQRSLTSRERPVVLLRKTLNSALSDLVAPGNDYVGVMLPYTPLHYLLISEEQAAGQALPFLVMTSANYTGEPIIKDNDEALRKLNGLADGFLLHDRDIYVHNDDSVVRILDGQELPVRRSRGYAPFPIKLPFAARPILAVGGELKATFCLTCDGQAFMSQHIGDMENLETLNAFGYAVDHMQRLFRIEPELLACDQHPDYLSSRWARKRAAGRPVIAVQHHHAHIASVMVENGLDGTQPVIGFAFDGTGYGTDGAIWGGEAFIADYAGFTRVAHLAYVPLPGGDASIRRPYRTALAHLYAAGLEWNERLLPVAACPPAERHVLFRQMENNFNTVPTSSMGRLFDAVAALVGLRQVVNYEGQAAIELEAMAAETDHHYDFSPADVGEEVVYNAEPVIHGIVEDLSAGVPLALISGKFHYAVAMMVAGLSVDLRARVGIDCVALSGGVFQNVTLLRLTSKLLANENFRVVTHRQVPPNDGGLALGQAAVAAWQYRSASIHSGQ